MSRSVYLLKVDISIGVDSDFKAFSYTKCKHWT